MPLMKITIWELPNCIQCQQTKREFDRRGIVYQTKRLDRSSKALARFRELGFTQAPIIETDSKRWSGFRLEKIKSLDFHIKNERAHGINIPPQPITQIADEVGDDE